MSPAHNSFGALADVRTPAGEAVSLARLAVLEKARPGSVTRLPYSLRVILEALLRTEDGLAVAEDDVRRLLAWDARNPGSSEVPFKPARVILQDFTGVPAVVDLAAMRSAVARSGGDPAVINPQCQVDLVIDHSVQVDRFGSSDALAYNAEVEFQRNRERYEFLRWGQAAYRNFRVVPPASGIVHQVNLEYLAPLVGRAPAGGRTWLLPDSLVGTDSHTTMINGLGVVGWGVGGIEAEAVMLGQPTTLAMPRVTGVRLKGRVREGVTATDVVLAVTQALRRKGVVDQFVEFCGQGLDALTLADRATLANMAPEYGATMGFFPVDDETLRYLRATGRAPEQVALVEWYCKQQGLFRTPGAPEPEFSDLLELDLGVIEPCLAGPRRPQDRVALKDLKATWRKTLAAPTDKGGFGVDGQSADAPAGAPEAMDGEGAAASTQAANGLGLTHGAVVIAAITSCTNTSNPAVMLAAGLLARKAVQAGLRVPPHVKTSLAPGSRVVTDYLDRAGLTHYLEALGFHTVGYGCTTCIGNSGPLPGEVARAIEGQDLVATAVLSGNRNFAGRIHPLTRANWLASPPLVVAYALAGTVDFDPESEPLGRRADGSPVLLRDVWPSSDEVQAVLDLASSPELYRARYQGIENANPQWNAIPVGGGTVYSWDASSTYIQEPPFFVDLPSKAQAIRPIRGARVLFFGGDSVTTDHISPAGDIDANGAAGRYLAEQGVTPRDFNSFGARRGNDRVMVRGTFGNIRLRNRLANGKEGSFTTHQPSGELLSIFDAARRYQSEGVPAVILAGRDYGMGSSRDWAAKGTLLLGVKAVLAESYERIHRSNLVGMGVLPLQFRSGENADSLGLTGRETYSIQCDDDLVPGQEIRVTATGEDGHARMFNVKCRIDTPVERDYYRNGGILPMVLRQLARA
jgi:aconitate hydratase